MSTTHDDGGPAYPVAYEHSDATCEQHGMSLRDYFAAKAMQGMWASDQPGYECSGKPDALMDRAITAYAQADAMLKARGAKP